MKLVKTFADHDTMLTAAVHQSGPVFVVRLYDRSQRHGLLATISKPTYFSACARAAQHVYGLYSRNMEANR
jgi:hypothetical protein